MIIGRETQPWRRTVEEETSQRKIHRELLAEEVHGVWKPMLLQLLWAEAVEQCWVLDGTGRQLQYSLR